MKKLWTIVAGIAGIAGLAILWFSLWNDFWNWSLKQFGFVTQQVGGDNPGGWRRRDHWKLGRFDCSYWGNTSLHFPWCGRSDAQEIQVCEWLVALYESAWWIWRGSTPYPWVNRFSHAYPCWWEFTFADWHKETYTNRKWLTCNPILQINLSKSNLKWVLPEKVGNFFNLYMFDVSQNPWLWWKLPQRLSNMNSNYVLLNNSNFIWIIPDSLAWKINAYNFEWNCFDTDKKNYTQTMWDILNTKSWWRNNQRKTCSIIASVCWDNKLDDKEECDDWNKKEWDWCNETCKLETINCDKVKMWIIKWKNDIIVKWEKDINWYKQHSINMGDWSQDSFLQYNDDTMFLYNKYIPWTYTIRLSFKYIGKSDKEPYYSYCEQSIQIEDKKIATWYTCSNYSCSETLNGPYSSKEACENSCKLDGLCNYGNIPKEYYGDFLSRQKHIENEGSKYCQQWKAKAWYDPLYDPNLFTITCEWMWYDYKSCKLNVVWLKCGDGIKNWPEQCDDGNSNENDWCNKKCVITPIKKENYAEDYQNVDQSNGVTTVIEWSIPTNTVVNVDYQWVNWNEGYQWYTDTKVNTPYTTTQNYAPYQYYYMPKVYESSNATPIKSTNKKSKITIIKQ